MEYPYDVAVSYASTEERYVGRVVKLLRQEGLRVFYAPDEQADLFGADLLERLVQVYGRECLYIALFLSPAYLERDFTRQEAAIALERQRGESRGCLCPIRFQKAELRGLNPDIVYLDGDVKTEYEVAHLLAEKVRRTKFRLQSGARAAPSPRQAKEKPPVVLNAPGGNVVLAGDIANSEIQCQKR